MKAGLEVALLAKDDRHALSRRDFLKGALAGTALATAGITVLETLQRIPASSPTPTVPPAVPPVSQPVGAEGPTILAQMDPALIRKLRDWRARTQAFFAGQKMESSVQAPGGFDIQGYRSYQSQPDHPYDRYLGVERFWVYDMGVTTTYLIQRGDLTEARWLADRMIDIAKQMEDQGQKGGWRFSYGVTFTDARAMSGGVAWVFKGLYEVALHTKDKSLLDWVNRKLVEVAFAQQVMNPQDPRYGLFRAGFGKSLDDDPAFQREEITIEHNWDYIEALRLAYRATRAVAPQAPILPQLVQRHDLAMQQSKAKLLLTSDVVRAQMARLRQAGRLTAELRTQHERVIKEIQGLSGQRRWATGMERDGTLNLSWAWDNEGWSPHGAYDPDLGYHELRNLEARFLKTLKARDFDHLPAGVNPNAEFTGLTFFTGDFQDPHVPPNPAYERMLQPEATWGYIFRLVQFGYRTEDSAKRAWAYNLAIKLVDSMLRLNDLYGGSPYATKDIIGYFNTMLAIASNGHQGIVSEILLRGGAPADDYLNVLPHPGMLVGGRRPVWAASQSGLEEWRSRLIGGLVALAVIGGGYGLYKLGQRSAAPPIQVGPIKVLQPAPPKPTPPAAPVVPTPPAQPTPPIQATVSPELLTVNLPSALAGKWAAAFLTPAGDIAYLQSVEQVPSGGGPVSFEVPVNPPNRPGWVAAGRRDVVLFESQDLAVEAAQTRSFVKATLPLRVGKDGSVTVLKGLLPKAGAEEQAGDETGMSRRNFLIGTGAGAAIVAAGVGFYKLGQRSVAPPTGPVAVTPAPAPPQPVPSPFAGTVIEPFIQAANQIKAIPAGRVTAVFWDPASATEADFKRLAEVGFTEVIVDGYGFVQGQWSQEQVAAAVRAAHQVGITSFKFVMGSPEWAYTGRQFAEEKVTALASEIVALRSRLKQEGAEAAAKILTGVVLDVEPYLATEWNYDWSSYVALRDRLKGIVTAEQGLSFDVFEPFWINHPRHENGRALIGYRADPAITTYIMSYRRDGAQAYQIAGSVGNQTPHVGGFDLVTEIYSGFKGKYEELPKAVATYVEKSFGDAGRQPQFRGAFVHAAKVADLIRLIDLTTATAGGREQRRIEEAQRQEAEQAEAQIKQEEAAKARMDAQFQRLKQQVKIGSITARKVDADTTQFTVTIVAPKTIRDRLQVVAFKKTDIYYRQPYEGAAYDIPEDGQVVIGVIKRGILGDVVFFVVDKEAFQGVADKNMIYSPGDLGNAVITSKRAGQRAQLLTPPGPRLVATPPAQRGVSPAQFLLLLVQSGEPDLRRVGELVLAKASSEEARALLAQLQEKPLVAAAQVSALTAGLEEAERYGMNRRMFLRVAAAGALTPFLPEFYGMTALEAAQPGPVGALVPLRAKLGPNRQIGLIIWHPGDLLRLPDFFPLAVKAGVDTVWISGFRFRQMTDAQRQAVLAQASNAGLKTIGFIDGNYDWAVQRAFVANHYRDLLGKLSQVSFGRLQVAFAVDVEPYTQRGWNGDLAGYMDLLEQVILPQIRAVVPRFPVVRFEPWWYENGRRTDDGATIRGLRPIAGTEIAAMTYRNRAGDIAEVSESVRRRARTENVRFQIGGETIPEAAGGTPSFAGKEPGIGPAFVGAIAAMPRADQDRLAGVFIHTQAPVAAHRILTELVRATPAAPEAPTTAGQPAKEFGVKDNKATRFAELGITLDLLLTKELLGLAAKGELVAVPFVQTDTWYIQPYENRQAMFVVGRNGQAAVSTVARSPFRGGATIGRAVMLLEKTQFDKFLQAYKDGGAREAAKLALKIIYIRDSGQTDIVEELPRSGLEESAETVRRFLTDGVTPGTVLVLGPSVRAQLAPEGQARLDALLRVAAQAGLEMVVEVPEDPDARRQLAVDLSFLNDRQPVAVTACYAGLEDQALEQFVGSVRLLGIQSATVQPADTTDFLAFLAQLQSALRGVPVSAAGLEALQPVVSALDFLA